MLLGQVVLLREHGMVLRDLIVSPEVVEQIRAMAYNPVNTSAARGITPTAATTIYSGYGCGAQRGLEV